MALTTIQYIYFFILYVGWWLVPLIVLFVYKRRLGKYPIDVTIYEKRGENLIKTNDVAGRFDNPINCYRLKKSKDSIPIPDYDWVLQCMYKPTNLFEKVPNMLAGKIGHLTLFKYGSKQYKPIDVKLDNGKVEKKLKPILNAKGEPIYVDVYEIINPKQSLSKVNFEVIDWDDVNHLTQELRATALRRSPVLKALEKYGALIGGALAVVGLIIAGYYYKEMIIDAGSRAQSMYTGQGIQPPGDANVNKGGGVPIIGDLFPPGS